MTHDPNAPIGESPGGIWIQRAVGVVALTAGLALFCLLLFALFGICAARPPVRPMVLIVTGVLGALTAFLLPVGWRMTFNWPNQHGSILSPVPWFGIAGLFLLCAGMMVSRDSTASAYAAMFSVLAAVAGRRARAASRPEPTRPT